MYFSKLTRAILLSTTLLGSTVSTVIASEIYEAQEVQQSQKFRVRTESVEGFRKAVQTILDQRGAAPELIDLVVDHQEFLVPLFEDWKNFLDHVSSTSDNTMALKITKFKEKTEAALNNNECSLRAIYEISFGYAGAISHGKISQDEIDFIGVTDVRDDYDRVRNGKRASLKTTGEGRFLSGSKTSSCAAEKAMDKEFARVPVLYPLPGNGIMALEDLIKLFVTGIYPIPFAAPADELDAHGLKLSPLGFAYHDFAHGIGFDRKLNDSLPQAVQILCDKYLGESVFAGDILPKVAKIVLDRHRLLQNFFVELTNKLVELNDQKTLSGLFFMIHELNVWSEKFYGANTLTNVFEILEEMMSTRGDASSEIGDPLKTNPKTGESPLTDKEIGALVLESDSDTTRRAAIKRTPLFISVDVEHQNGTVEKVKKVYPTLLYHVLSLQDNISLLANGGRTVSPLPEILSEGLAASRQQVLEKVEEVDKAVKALVLESIESIKGLIAEGTIGSDFMTKWGETIVAETQLGNPIN